MNRFGRFAWESWRELAPTALAQMPDPIGYFSRVGETALAQWTDLWPELVEPDLEGEDFHHKAGRIEAAKMRAEEMIRAELLVPPQELQEADDPDQPGPLAEVIEAWRDVTTEDLDR